MKNSKSKFESLRSGLFDPLSEENLSRIKGGTDTVSTIRTYNPNTEKWENDTSTTNDDGGGGTPV